MLRDISEWKRLDRMKNEFVSTVSHELRTPLTLIRGALGLLESGVGGALTTQAQELVRIGRGNTERLIRLIGDMLDLDKIEAGRLDLHLATLMPAELVRTAVDGVQVIAEQFQVRIEEHVEAHRTLEGDHDRVIQVLTNFLSNAVKFSPPGSVVTRISGDGGYAGVGSDPGAGGARTAGRAPVRFVVENPGPGIAPGISGCCSGGFSSWTDRTGGSVVGRGWASRSPRRSWSSMVGGSGWSRRLGVDDVLVRAARRRQRRNRG